MCMKLDVGASAYWSEIASVQTLDNLLMQGKIELVDYLERIPEGYISKRAELISKYSTPQIPQDMPQVDMNMPPLGGGQLVDTGAQETLPTGRGYSELQRQLNRAGN